MLFKSEPTTSEKIKDTARAVADQAAQKAAEAEAKAEKDIMPVITEKAEEARVIIAEKAEEAREAAKPHLEKVAEATAEQREAAEKKLAEVKAAAEKKREEIAAAAEQARKDADKKGRKLSKRADKKAGKAQKKADKKKDALLAIAAAKAAQAEKKATKTFGPQAREEVSYKAAALRGRAEAIAEDKHLTADDARDYYKNEVLPHLKELIAAAAAAGTAASHNVVGQLPDGAQKQVAHYAPVLAPKKKGGFLMIVGAGALAGAGYLVYADQQKKRACDAKLSQDAIADSRTPREESMTINNPVTNFEKADDTTMVRPGAVQETTVREPAEPADGPGTAATWVDAEATGHMTTEGLEDPSVIEETRSSRRAARDDQ